MSEPTRRGLALAALLAGIVLFGACEEESTGPTHEPCTDALVAHVSTSGVPAHAHKSPLLCQEDRGGVVDYRLRGTDHEHAVGFSRLEVGDILAGEALGKTSTESRNHTHWVGFHH